MFDFFLFCCRLSYIVFSLLFCKENGSRRSNHCDDTDTHWKTFLKLNAYVKIWWTVMISYHCPKRCVSLDNNAEEVKTVSSIHICQPAATSVHNILLQCVQLCSKLCIWNESYCWTYDRYFYSSAKSTDCQKWIHC